MKMVRIVFFTLLGISTVFGQNQSLEPNEAESMFAKKRFTAVWQYYQNLLMLDSVNSDLNFKMGVCYLNSRSQKEKAISYFKRASRGIDHDTSMTAIDCKLLADACYLVSDFDDAIENYERYKKTLLISKNNNNALLDEINQEIEMCKMAKELKELKELTAVFKNHKCKNRGINNNLSTLNYSTDLPNQQSFLSFVFRKPPIAFKTLHDNDLFEENYTISNTIFKTNLKSTDTTNDIMESTIASSVDVQIILIYRDDKGEGNLYACELNGNEWMKPEKINKIINNRSWEPNEFISANGNTLYFASNREGGFGGMDIYKSIKLPNGQWGKAVNMGPVINTSYDEEAPFIYPDGSTLYFSSNRFRAKGGFDNFTSVFSDSIGWTMPINVGYPLNKTDSISRNIKNEEQNTALKKENYRITFINQKKTPITVIKGKIIGQDGIIPKYTEVTISNNETGEIAGIYHPDSKTGKYLCIVPSEKNINVTYEAAGFIFHSENINISKDSTFFKLQQPINLVPIAAGSKIILNNVFFEDNKATLSSTSDIELNKLYSFLNLNPKLIIELSCSIDKKSTAYDIKLAQDKIQMVLNFLFEKGIDKNNVVCKVYKNQKLSKKKYGGEAFTENEPGKLELKIIAFK
jgi:tetratricopeptide (TPR) repeat protein